MTQARVVICSACCGKAKAVGFVASVAASDNKVKAAGSTSALPQRVIHEEEEAECLLEGN